MLLLCVLFVNQQIGIVLVLTQRRASSERSHAPTTVREVESADRLDLPTVFQMKTRTPPPTLNKLFQATLAILISCGIPGSAAMTVTASDLGLDEQFEVELLHHEDFGDSLANWTAEVEDKAKIAIVDGKLDINTKRGCTVWFNHKLSQSLAITYDVTILNDGLDELPRDHNLFWMASNPKDPNVRPSGKGSLGDYDHYEMYYAGIGGNKNQTTRFRRYQEGNRVLKKEFRDKDHLNAANQTYHMKVICMDGRVQVFRDGKVYWDFTDTSPYTEGWFGFRQTRTHLRFDNFKVYSLKAKQPSDQTAPTIDPK